MTETLCGARTMAADDNGSLKIAFYCPGWPAAENPTGIVSYVTNLRGSLHRQGVRSFVLAARVEGEHDQDVIQARSPFGDGRSIKRALSCLAWRIRNWCPVSDLIVKPWLAADRILREVRRLKESVGLQLLEMQESFGWARFVARRSPVPVVVRLHGPWFLVGPATGTEMDLAGRVRREGLGIGLADGVSAPSRDTLVRTRRFYRMNLSHAEFIPSAISVVPRDAQWSLDRCDRRRILFVGRFDRLKGGDLIVEAFARVVRARPESRLTFVGPGKTLTDDSGRLWLADDFIRDRLPDPALRSCVERLGRRSHEQILPLRQRSMVTVVCSRYENFPNVVLEAMACGCPVVAPRVGGVPEIIQHGRNGLLFTPGDPADLAEKILTLLSGPALAKRLGRQALLDCRQRYDPDMIARKTIRFYRSVIERRQAGPGRMGQAQAT